MQALPDTVTFGILYSTAQPDDRGISRNIKPNTFTHGGVSGQQRVFFAYVG